MITYNPEAEKAILGCMIIDNVLIRKIQANFKPEYFYTPMNQSLYLEILKLYEKHGTVDIPMLFEFDIEYVSEICKAIATTQNARQYVNIVRNLGIRRELFKAAEKVRDIAMSEDIDDIQIIKSEALATINNVQLLENRRLNTKAIDIVTNSMSNLEKRYKQGANTYRSWKLNWLQDKTGGVKPEYTILAARPSVGKTAFALQIAKEIALQGGKVAIFSLEMPSEACINRIICNHGNINKDYFDKPGILDEKGWDLIGRTSPVVAMLPLTIYDDIFYIEEVILKCEELKASEGLDFVVIDYIQLMETTKKTANANERISHISRNIKKMQQRNKIHVLALSQFNRESETQTVPTLRNLRDSGSLEQDGNNVWFLHVDPKDIEGKDGVVETQLIIAKQREGERNIKKKLKFYAKTQKFYEN
jgi:replicative DNA helicase